VPRFGRQALLAAGGVVLLGICFELVRRLGNLKLYVVETISLGLAAGIAYLILLYLFEHSSDDRSAFWMILAGAVLFRALLLPLPPTLSDDMYRYIWDAKVQQDGHNPYALRPDDPSLAHLRDDHYLRVSGRDITALYPPLAEHVFRATYLVAKGPVAFKLPFVLGDLAVIAMLAAWLRASGGRNHSLALYAWNPLVIVEFSASGHFDSLALALVFAAGLLVARRREAVSTALLTAAALIKAYPVLLLPLWLRRVWRARPQRAWTNAAIAAGLAIACAAPYWRAWPTFLLNMRYYESSWINNASLAAILDWFSGSHELTVGLGAGVSVGLALWAAGRRLDSMRAGYLIVGAVLLLSPNAFSWYFTWIIPFLCFFPNPAWLMLTVLQFFSYHVLIGYQAAGEWRFDPLFLWLTYGPFFALLLLRRLLPPEVDESAPPV